MTETRVPVPTLERLAIYLRVLLDAHEAGIQTLSSQEMEQYSGISAAQFRKDLSYFGEFGKPGVGYSVQGLIACIERILRLDEEQPILLVGAGNINKVIKTELRLQQILQREPTDEEIAAETKMSVERVREIRRAAVEPISIESPVGERDNATLGEFIPSSDIVPTPEDVTERLILREQIDMILEKLQPRERDVVRLRFGLDDGHQRTLEEVGAELKITRERVRQLELRALRKLRQIGERIEDLRRNQGLELEEALALIDTDFQ